MSGWYKRVWVLALAALVVGLILGAVAGSAGSDPKSSTEYKALASRLVDTKAQLDDTREQVTAIQGDLPQREEQVKQEESALSERDSKLQVREEDVARRERKVGIVERTIERNTVAGEGIYQVGKDMKPGTYRTKGEMGCYYAILNSPNTSDIADNNNVDGPAIVSLSTGKYFEVSGCADWVLAQ